VKRPALVLLGSLALSLPVLAQVQVHVVDAAGGPGADSTSLGGAVNPAADGDIVLVRAGVYPDLDGIVLDGKGLVVVAEVGAQVVTERVRVQNLPLRSHVLVQGITFSTFEHLTADLDACAGPLWFEDCAFTPQGPSLQAGGMFPTGCDALVLSRCTVTGVPLTFPSTALIASDSRLHLFESTVLGQAGDILAALELRDGSFLELFGSSVDGGDGASGQFLHCDGFDGGDALLLGTGALARVLGSSVQGGAGGAPLAGCNPGQPGEDYVLDGGTLELLAGQARSLALSSPVRDDAQATLTLGGLPGDRVWLRISPNAGTGIVSPAWDGELLLGSPRFGVFAGTIPAGGQLQLSVPVPDLAPGVEGAVYHCQALFRDAGTGRFLVSTPSALVVVDDSF